nr:phosphatase PAP2 family protein [uncultured Pedobacter sp.]
MKIKLKPNKIFSKLFYPSLYTLVILLLVLIFHQLKGNTQAFLFINQNHLPFFDLFFKYITNLGDGLVWLILAVVCLFFYRKRLPIVFANFVLSTVLAQLLKRLIFPNALRPIHLVQEGFQVHLVEGVKIYTHNSFPSGHTISAFAVAFTILILLKKNNPFKYFFIGMAFLVGLSRVYLAEHYLIDVIAGAFIGIMSTYLSVYSLSFLKKSKYKVQESSSVELNLNN